MEDLVDQIAQLDPLLIDQALAALVQRCNELFPEHELTTLFLRKADPHTQIDNTIQWLQTLKEYTPRPLPPVHFPTEAEGIITAQDLLTKSQQARKTKLSITHRSDNP